MTYPVRLDRSLALQLSLKYLQETGQLWLSSIQWRVYARNKTTHTAKNKSSPNEKRTIMDTLWRAL